MAVRNDHIVELQSVRGLAATVVLLHHCSFYFAIPDRFHSLLESALNAHAAVVTFFVLSGYVLYAALAKYRLGVEEIVRFLTRRVFRIYPAVWFACAVSLFLLTMVNHDISVPFRSAWGSTYFMGADRTLHSELLSFAGVGIYLVPPLWSITVELVGSALIVFIALASRGRPDILIGIVVLLAALSLALPEQGRSSIVAAYMVHFALGASVTVWSGMLKGRVGVLLAIVLVALCLVVMATFRLLGGWNFTDFYNAPLPGLAEGVMAALMIGLIVCQREAFALLRTPMLVALGDVSFSVYLLHFPVMVTLAIVLDAAMRLPVFGTWPWSALTLMAATFAATLPLAVFSYRWIELPGIALGKEVLARLMSKGVTSTQEFPGNPR